MERQRCGAVHRDPRDVVCLRGEERISSVDHVELPDVVSADTRCELTLDRAGKVLCGDGDVLEWRRVLHIGPKRERPREAILRYLRWTRRDIGDERVAAVLRQTVLVRHQRPQDRMGQEIGRRVVGVCRRIESRLRVLRHPQKQRSSRSCRWMLALLPVRTGTPGGKESEDYQRHPSTTHQSPPRVRLVSGPYSQN